MLLTINDTSNVVRVIVFQWHDVSTTAPDPSVSSILLSGPTGVIDYLSQYNHDTRQSYKILLDKTFTLNGNGTQAAALAYPLTTSSTIVRHYRISLKNARKHVQYQGGGTQATNRLFWIYMSDSAAPGHPGITGSFKTFFRDS